AAALPFPAGSRGVGPAGGGARRRSRPAAQPSFVAALPGVYVLSLAVSDGARRSTRDVGVITAANRPPVADAGADLLLPIGATAFLDGTQSFDPDFDRITYEWSFLLKPDTSRAILTRPTSATPEFVVDAPGVFLVQLTVSDGRAASRPAVVMVKTHNSAPIPNAGGDRTARVGGTIRPDGSRSGDLDRHSPPHAWNLPPPPISSPP